MLTTQTIKTIQDIMRKDRGINGDAQRIEQLVWMIFPCPIAISRSPQTITAKPPTRLDQKSADANPDLARIVNAWPALPEHIRRAILVLVEGDRA